MRPMTVDQYNAVAELLAAGMTPAQFGGPYTKARALAEEVQRMMEMLERQGGHIRHICSAHGCEMSQNPNKPGYIYCEECYPNGAPK